MTRVEVVDCLVEGYFSKERRQGRKKARAVDTRAAMTLAKKYDEAKVKKKALKKKQRGADLKSAMAMAHTLDANKADKKVAKLRKKLKKYQGRSKFSHGQARAYGS